VSTDLLVFVEDPGAANWIVALAPALARSTLSSRVLAAGAAQAYLRDRGIAFETLSHADDASALLDRVRPRMVMTGTSENLDTLGLALIAEARRRGLPTLSYVDQAANAEHRFRGRSGSPLAYAPDMLLLPDEAARAAFSALGFPQSRIVVTGNPHHDRVAAAAHNFARDGRAAVRARMCPTLPADRPLVVFLSEIGYVVNPEGPDWEQQFTLTGRGPDFPRGRATYRTAIVLEEVIDALAVLSPRPLLVVRLHPKNARDEFTAYGNEVDAFSADGDPLALVYAADLVVGMTTALLEEAHIIGRSTLAVLPRAAERDWLEALRTGRIRCVTERTQIRPSIVSALAQSRERACDHAPTGSAAAIAVQAIAARLVAGRHHG
jgi:hypothetical protein